MNKDVVLTLTAVGLSGCIATAEPNVIKNDEIPQQEVVVTQPNDYDIPFKKSLGESITHCYYWEPTENIKK